MSISNHENRMTPDHLMLPAAAVVVVVVMAVVISKFAWRFVMRSAAVPLTRSSKPNTDLTLT